MYLISNCEIWLLLCICGTYS